MNQAETEGLRRELFGAGGELAKGFSDADVCVINTCTVTRQADKDALLLLRRIARRNPAARVVVTGCLATRAREEVLEACPGAIIVPNAEKEKLSELIRQATASGNGLGDDNGLGNGDGGVGETDKTMVAAGGGLAASGDEYAASGGMEGRSRASIKIQDGCRQGCSYCIVPSVRPTLSSKPADYVEGELRRLLDEGFSEIVLCGIRLGSYKDAHADFNALLGRLLGVPGDFRLRLSSLEITDIDGPFLDLLDKAGERLCPSFHLPLQSGSDSVLRRMKRWYTAEEYARRLSSLKARRPEGGFFSDILVGFPGETEAEFEETARAVGDLGLSGLHVFRYSARAGTLAAALPGRLPEGELQSRAERMREVDRGLREAFARASVGSRRRVVVEKRGDEPAPSPGGENDSPPRTSGPRPTALTDHFLRVRLDRDPGPGLHGAKIVRAAGGSAEAVVE